MNNTITPAPSPEELLRRIHGLSYIELAVARELYAYAPWPDGFVPPEVCPPEHRWSFHADILFRVFFAIAFPLVLARVLSPADVAIYLGGLTGVLWSIPQWLRLRVAMALDTKLLAEQRRHPYDPKRHALRRHRHWELAEKLDIFPAELTSDVVGAIVGAEKVIEGVLIDARREAFSRYAHLRGTDRKFSAEAARLNPALKGALIVTEWTIQVDAWAKNASLEGHIGPFYFDDPYRDVYADPPMPIGGSWQDWYRYTTACSCALSARRSRDQPPQRKVAVARNAPPSARQHRDTRDACYAEAAGTYFSDYDEPTSSSYSDAPDDTDYTDDTDYSPSLNPTSGLQMIPGTVLDVGGHVYGVPDCWSD